MINANELRIGNWVLLKSKPTKIESLNETGINLMVEGGYYAGEASFDFEGYFLPYFGNKTEIVEPIPITPDILLKCGFEKGENFYKDEPTYYKDEYFISGTWFHKKSFVSKLHKHANVLNDELKYLHQLQNLYFSLTNNELNIEGL